MSSAANTPSLQGTPLKFSRDFWAGLCLFVLVVLPFLPAIHGQYIWDDNNYLTENAAVHAWNGLWTIWNPWIPINHFYPLTYTTFWVEYKLWGLNPVGYHLNNMLLQAASALVLWRTLKYLGFKAAWLAALVWAIHPIQVETVAWVTERKNTLSGVFCFLSAWAYFKFEGAGDEPRRERRWGFYGLAFLAFVLGLLAKSAICTLPAGLLIVMWWKDQRLTWRMIWPLIPLLVCALAFAVFTSVHEKGQITEGNAADMSFTWANRFIIAGKDVWFYLRTLVAPYPLMPVNPRWTYDASAPLNYVPIFAVVVLAATLFVLRKRIGLASFLALAFFLVNALPVLGFINFYTMHYTFVADHYQYFACAGVIVWGVEMCHHCFQRLEKGFAPANWAKVERICAGVYVLVLGSLCAFYASLYQTNLKLWGWNVAHNSAAYVAHQSLASAEVTLYDFSDADIHIQTALAEAPDDDAVQRMAGLLKLAEKKYPEAIEHFRLAAQIRPGMSLSYLYMGDVYMAMHDLPHALETFAKAVEVTNGDSRNYFHYAGALVAAHQPEKAVEMYKIGLQLSPGQMIARYNYGNLLLDMGRLPEAIEQYKFILKYQEDNALVWHNLAVAYYQGHQMDQALAAKQRADALDAQLRASPPQPASASEP
jgi:protein O-mannosyl-transferase